jgi:hypothetical protein
MSKARSRLTKLSKNIAQNLEKEKLDFKKIKKDFNPNQLRFSNLIISLAFYLITYYLLTSFFPKQIENILIPNSYILILIPFFFGNLFLFGFLSLRLRRGFLISFFITAYFFLKLQQINFNLWLMLKLGLILIFFEIIFMHLQKLRLKK